jgi:alkylation response protein AidB-like acyl-CoA dehydrogenase
MTLPGEHAAILDTVDRFCRAISPADVARRDAEHIPPYDFIPKLAELGLTRVTVPESEGGLGLPWSLFCRIQERIGYTAQPVASILNRLVSFGVMPLVQFGTGAQKAARIPALLDGQALVALALSEPGAGSDARAVATRAERTSDGWRITGRKTWISDADAATHLLTLCCIAGPDAPGDGLAAFLVPRHCPGIAMTVLPKAGNNCMPSYDIGYDAVTVTEDDLLGAPGAGFRTVTGTLRYSRASLSATIVGSATAALDLAIAHAGEREQFGRPLGAFQVIRHRLVDMRMEVQKARLMVRELARMVDAGEDCEVQAAMTKVAATEMFQYVADRGMQILASAGYAAESPMQRYWRDARLYSFGEGANEIQREIVARHMGLGGRSVGEKPR